VRKQLRISPVGLRGVVGGGLTAAHVIDFASAFGTFLDSPGPVLVGRDPRASGIMMREGVIAALMGSGHDVVDLGLVSTPIIQHAIRRLDAAGGVSIGASHNAAEWNALKFFGPRGTYLSSGEANELLDIFHLKNFRRATWQHLGQLRTEDDACDRYIDELAQVFNFAALTGFRILVDCSNGISSLILNRINERYGTQFILLNQRMEGRSFSHEPATTSATVALQLAPLMRPVNADAGFLFDVDSDRVAVATEDGTPITEEMILPLVAEFLLPRSKGKLVITNLSTSALLDDIAARHGGTVVRVPVGRQATIDALATFGTDQVAVAGEGNGAVMMPQFRFVYDGIASMLAILTMMDERKQRLSRIIAGFPRYSILKGTVPLVSQRIPALLMELAERHSAPPARVNTQDGIRVDWPDHWFHVRVSQTEPLVRIIAEQRGSEPRELFDTLMEQVRNLA
jgi:phosphomannomutase